MSMFEKALRRKLRFETQNGMLTVEDLWDLPLSSKQRTSLDSLACAVYKRIEQSEKVSFVVESKQADSDAILALDILKHIIAVKQAENDETAKRRDLAKKKEKILEIIERKEDEKLEGASVDELREMVNSLGVSA